MCVCIYIIPLRGRKNKESWILVKTTEELFLTLYMKEDIFSTEFQIRVCTQQFYHWINNFFNMRLLITKHRAWVWVACRTINLIAKLEGQGSRRDVSEWLDLDEGHLTTRRQTRLKNRPPLGTAAWRWHRSQAQRLWRRRGWPAPSAPSWPACRCPRRH